MIKIIAMLKRKEGLTHKQFSDYWFEKHAPFAMRVAPMDAANIRYVQNHAVSLTPGGEAPYDAVAELSFPDRAALQIWVDWYGSDAAKPLRDDELNFMDISKRVIVITDERVLRDRAPR